MLAAAIRRLAGGAASLRELEQQHPGRSILTRADQLIYGELDPMTEVYLLTAGMVRLFAGEGAHARTALLLAAPALFGDRDILAGCTVAQESARSVSKACLLCFQRAELESAYASDAEVRELITRDLLQRYARTVRFASYLALPLEQRILWLLHEHHPGGRGELPAYENLALMTDSAVKSVGRAMRTLQEQTSLRVDQGRNFEIAPEVLAELGTGEHLGLFHHLALRGF